MLSYMLSKPSFKNFMLEPLLTNCMNLVKTFANCFVSHVYKKANRCVDSLAKIGAMQSTYYLLLHDLLLEAESVLVFNKI